MYVELLDTTLRDGAQGEGISFSVHDKIAIVRALDELGIPWIEAGNPGSNPKDAELFSLAGKLPLERSRLCAFGPTRRPGLKAAADPQLAALLASEAPAVSIFGKSWDLHVREVLRVSPEENIAMIAETTAYLKARGRFVFFDAEHFFDGYGENPAYALETIRAAAEAGADRIVLCDTNGASFPGAVAAAVKAAAALLGGSPTTQAPACVDHEAGSYSRMLGWPDEGGPDKSLGLKPQRSTANGGAAGKSAPLLGIHAHDDMGLAIANTLAALDAGCVHAQGTLVGFGERCGNTALAALVPSLELKLGRVCLPEGKLRRISELARLVAEVANVALRPSMPYVGGSAFSHKGGMHSDGVLKVRRSFEHIDPALVGNGRRLLLSEVGGRSAIADRARRIDPAVTRDHPVAAALAEKLKGLEAAGWAFEGAGASFELLVRRELERRGPERREPLFTILAYRVMSEHPTGQSIACSHAWVKVWVNGQDEIAAAEGDGPVHALDGALRRALARFYPQLEAVRLTDYKVRVIDGGAATAAKVRVLIESTDGRHTWTTLGVSEDIIDASRAALVDSIEYKLIGDGEGGEGGGGGEAASV